MADGSPLEAMKSLRWQGLRRIGVGFAALVSVLIFGVSGYVLLGWNLSDALYMVVITVSGVGYTEVHEVNSGWLRLHTILIITFGLVATGYLVTSILRFVTEEQIQQLLGHHRVRRQIEMLKDHTIIVGFGRMGTLIGTELAASELPFVVIDKQADRGQEIEQRGWLYLIGDATEEKVLQDAGVERAKALVTVIPSDATNVFITLTARELAPDVQIVARAEQPSTRKKLIQAGANHVVLPTAIGAHRIASLLTNPSAVAFTELMTDRATLPIEMVDVQIEADGRLAGRTLRETDIGRRTGVVVLAVKRADGRVDFPPTGDEPLAIGDCIVLLGRRANLAQFRQVYLEQTGQSHIST
ncbi:MAG: potassium channel protein [Isosphaeraceae bacterium]